MTTFHYEDADVPITAPLLKKILKRNWIGKDGNVSRPSLAHAMEGLSPFLMLDLSEDQVAAINDEADLLTHASLVSVKDLRHYRQKMKVCVPTTADEFLLLLKRYANLLFALFTSSCPLFKCIKEIISALQAYSREARKRMSMHTRGSILWIILLQSRQFGLGEVNILFEFSSMHSDLRSKKATIHHSEMPAELILNSTDDEDTSPQLTGGLGPSTTKRGKGLGGDDADNLKRQRKSNPNNWNPKLKAVLEAPLKKAKFPTFTKIMNWLKKDAYHIYPRGSEICVPNAIFGRCFHGEKCHKKHVVAPEDKVQDILKLVEPFTKDPTKVNLGQ